MPDSYAGELPICSVQLFPDVTITLADSDDNNASQLQEVLDGYLFQSTVKN